MDVKKLAGLVLALGLAAVIIKNATPGALAMIEVGLVGLLYFIRRRRPTDVSARVRKELFRATAARAVENRSTAAGTRARKPLAA